jgi:hypothetical protein
VALGNVGEDEPRTRAALRRHADGDDDLLAEHARWALERLEERRGGVGSTEPPRSGGAGSAGAGSGIRGVGSTEPPRSGGAGFAGAGAGSSGVGSTEPPRSGGAGFAGAGSGA